jgi:hypothetical protein
MSPLISSHNSPHMVKNSCQVISGEILASVQKLTLILMFLFISGCFELAANSLLLAVTQMYVATNSILVAATFKCGR